MSAQHFVYTNNYCNMNCIHVGLCENCLASKDEHDIFVCPHPNKMYNRIYHSVE